MPTVEGFTPQVAWTTLYGFIALCVLFMLVYKVFDAIRNEIERRHKIREAQAPDLADKVSRKVIETLEPRFQEIERNLTKDTNRINEHEQVISKILNSQRDTKEGLVAICKTLLVIANYGNLGESDKVKEASDELTRYLADRL
jgi:hypothetical protein